MIGDSIECYVRKQPVQSGLVAGSIRGFLVGLLKAEATITNANKFMEFLRDRLGGKSIEFTVEVDGKKLSAKANSREELDYAISAANAFIEKWHK